MMEFIGLQIARVKFYGEKDKVQPLTNFFTGARSMLVTLPVGYEDATIAGNALREFRDRMSHLQLTVVNTSTRATSLIDFPKCEVIRINPADLNRLSLPTQSLLQRVLVREYDVAIDLNLDFVLHSAYICKASRAQVRVGFVHPAADIFFNVQFNSTSPRTPQSIYGSFASCLGMF